MSKLYPVGVQNFEGLIHDGYVYVTKQHRYMNCLIQINTIF